MAMMLLLGCENCGTQYRFLQMTKDDPLDPCPKCGNTGEQQLSAPAIGKGAQPQTQWQVPESRAKREDLAFKIAEEQGATDIRTGQRQGDIAAVLPPTPKDEALRPRFAHDVGNTPEAIHNSITTLTGGMGAAANTNKGILAKIQGRGR